ncbi:MAG TPA: M1 family peptidase, partial [Puia sp.]
MKPYFLLPALLFIIFSIKTLAQQPVTDSHPARQDTLKGSITPERRWWDLLHYDLTVKPDYGSKTVAGSNIIGYRVVETVHTREMQIDLQAPLTIDSIRMQGQRLICRREGDAWFIQMPPQKRGSIHSVTIYYSGRPKESTHAP